MPSLRSLLSKIKNSIKKPGVKPVALKTKISRQGHFGAAFGNIEKRKRAAAGGPIESAFTPQERSKWHAMPADTLQSFVYLGVTIPMHSSNVAAAKYDIDNKVLTIWFHGGKKSKMAEYIYSSVTENEAIEFASYASKGGWTWDRLRIRGTKYGHRKPYRRMS